MDARITTAQQNEREGYPVVAVDELQHVVGRVRRGVPARGARLGDLLAKDLVAWRLEVARPRLVLEFIVRVCNRGTNGLMVVEFDDS
jgi:hypothetical protein